MRLKNLTHLAAFATAFTVASTAFAADGLEAGPKDNKLSEAEKEVGWELMFNGENLDGWKASENGDKNAFRVENGLLVTNGSCNHLFYGEDGNFKVKNFEFKTDVYVKGASNSGIYFHTSYIPGGWPIHQGFEAQVCNGFGDRQKTASIYDFSTITESPVKDDEWFTYHIKVEGDNVKIWINDQLIQNWTQPADWKEKGRRLSSGTIAMQAHDPGSFAFFKNVRILDLDK